MNRRIARPLVPAIAAALVALLLTLPGQPATAQPERADGAAAATSHAGHHTHLLPFVTRKELELRNEMRRLWEDHVVWTRMAIVSFAADLPDFDHAAQRLLRNQDDIGDAIAPYYGRSAGDQLTALLREHILIAVDVLVAAKAGDEAALADALAEWDRNAVDIATFLHNANPRNWPQAEMEAMMREHLDLTTQEAVARLTGDFDADIAAYDAIHAQALEMADMLSIGIVRQFPLRFLPG